MLKLVIVALTIYTFSIYFSLKAYPENHPIRRYSNIIVDISVITTLMFLLGEYGTFFYVLYLWIIIGNGIRFGVRHLYFSMAVGNSGILILITNAPFWLKQPVMSLALLFGCIVLPLFFISIVNRLTKLNEHLEHEIKKRTDELIISEQKLKQQNQNLEYQVSERTKEIEKNLKSLSQRSIELEHEVNQRKASEKKLTYFALHDALTNLPNRNLLYESSLKILAHAKRDQSMVAILYIDLDNFKPVNDNNDHETGDIVLVETSLRLSNITRETDIVSRVGGDEFIIVLSKCDSLEYITEISKRILTSLSKPIDSIKIKECLSASIGISIYPDTSTNFAELIKCADKAMYQSKNKGGNQLTYYSEA